jgi:hypothetical protein
LEATIAQQLQRGVSGLHLGVSYEARAQVALWTDDQAGFQHYARLTAREYRYGAQSTLGARYDRLVNEASRYGLQVDSTLADFETESMVGSSALPENELQTLVMRSMVGAERAQDRAKAALQLICDMRGVGAGHLYLAAGNSWVLGASRGEVPPQNLDVIVRDYVTEEEHRSESMTAMLTGNVSDEAPDAASTRVGDTDYQLLLLSCVVDGVAQVTGVAAVAKGAKTAHNVQQGHLLSALAKQLLARSA